MEIDVASRLFSRAVVFFNRRGGSSILLQCDFGFNATWMRYGNMKHGVV